MCASPEIKDEHSFLSYLLKNGAQIHYNEQLFQKFPYRTDIYQI